MSASLRNTALLLLLLATAVTFVMFPMMVIQPFKAQYSNTLAVALVLQRWKPLVTVLCAVLVLLLAVMLWRTTSQSWTRYLRKTGLVLGVVLALAVAFVGQINIFEKMFHPITRVDYLSAAQSGVQPGDMVMAVTYNGQSRAYPILEMAYHHVVNDVVGGVPIAVTY